MKNVYIIGGGVSGLVAAIELERAGLVPTIIEKASEVGGRVRTDEISGLLFDHGFQVLLTAYPAAKRYLNFTGLQLQRFLPGAVIYQNGKTYRFGDPLRNKSFLKDTALSPIATVWDKFKVWQLSYALKQQSLDRIFSAPEKTTFDFLKEYGFSNRIIETFFRPFYSGIFLEPELRTSSRMFQFVFKMFAEGHAAIPRGGIQAIPTQLRAQLQRTQFKLETGVRQVTESAVVLDDGTSLPSDLTIIATDPSDLLEGYTRPSIAWHSCSNLYFTVPRSTLKEPIIGLVADPDALINNLHFPTDLVRMGEEALLSVTVVKDHELDEEALAERVTQELAQYCGIEEAQYLRSYPIARALPALQDMQYAPTAETVRYADNILLAGDITANPSLNAAMEAGRLAGQLGVEQLKGATV